MLASSVVLVRPNCFVLASVVDEEVMSVVVGGGGGAGGLAPVGKISALYLCKHSKHGKWTRQ